MTITKTHGDKYAQKALPFFVTDSDELLGEVTAIVSVFGVVDDGNDRIWPGAFVKTITESGSRVKVLDQHQTDSTNRVLGKPVWMKEVGRTELPSQVLQRFPEATGGLLTKTQYNMKTQAGAEAFYRISAGDVTEYSIGYTALDTDISIEVINGKKTSVRNIRTLRLWEFSPVLWGMNPATATVDFKNGEDSVLDTNKKDYVAEMETAISGEPVSLLGDKIHACLSMAMIRLIADLYEDGWLSFEEFTQIQIDGITKLAEFRSMIPESVTNREYEDSFYYTLMNGKASNSKEEVKTVLTQAPQSKEVVIEEKIEEKTEVISVENETKEQSSETLAGPIVTDPNESPTDVMKVLRDRAERLNLKIKLIGDI